MMVGLRADYEIDENFNIGVIFLKFFEWLFIQKVNVGDDFINNNIYGMDFNLSCQVFWLICVVDVLFGLFMKEFFSIMVVVEVAVI